MTKQSSKTDVKDVNIWVKDGAIPRSKALDKIARLDVVKEVNNFVRVEEI